MKYRKDEGLANVYFGPAARTVDDFRIERAIELPG
jgi:hypothetical protein